ncbi:Hypothetical predicted protein [Pelobates cultripes]|uniref:Uncharacterized protein n=1 Tax=Pelobates cultripes TaxID=61616 RepID=A0AAD1WEH0_PELCU|nr:Hypothetical predicted protein [Pelobates cultripes]
MAVKRVPAGRPQVEEVVDGATVQTSCQARLEVQAAGSGTESETDERSGGERGGMQTSKLAETAERSGGGRGGRRTGEWETGAERGGTVTADRSVPEQGGERTAERSGVERGGSHTAGRSAAERGGNKTAERSVFVSSFAGNEGEAAAGDRSPGKGPGQARASGRRMSGTAGLAAGHGNAGSAVGGTGTTAIHCPGELTSDANAPPMAGPRVTSGVGPGVGLASDGRGARGR